MINLFRDIPSSKPNFYFLANGTKFYNNVNAYAEASKRRDSRVEFVLDYDIYRNPGAWRAEPLLESKDYFRKHARILAEKYDDITIHYSGGTDSHTILDAFIDAGVRNVKLWYRTSLGMEDFAPRIKLFNRTREELSKKYGEKLKQLNYTMIGMDTQDVFSTGSTAEWRLALENFVGDYDRSILNCTESIKHYHTKHKNVKRIKSNACMVWGLEKPYVVLVKGTWYWVTFSNKWFHYDTPSSKEYDTVFFFFNDEVPELPVKLTWLKIEAIEKIIKTHGNIKFSEAEILAKRSQDTDSDYYTFINESMGYKGLDRVLNGNYWRASRDYSDGRKHINYKKEKSGISRETQYFFEENISKRVDPKYIKGDNSLYSVSSRCIPIRKCNLELRE